MTSTTLARRLHARQPVLGGLLPLPNQLLVEHAGHGGFDFVVIDTEHGPGDDLALSTHLVAADAHGLDVLVRVGEPREALRALDLGATGVVVPHVSSVEEARAVVDAVQYPPRGTRGFATYTRAGRYGRVDPAQHVARARDDVVVVAMIEDPDGVEAARAIAEVGGIGGLFLGPADLACALGVPGRWDDPRVVSAWASVRDDAHAGGGALMSICPDPDAARDQFAAGSDAVVYNLQGALSTMFTGLAAARPVPASVPDHPHPALEPLLLLPGMLGAAGTWDDVAARLEGEAAPRVSRIDLDESVAEMAASVLADAPARFALAGHSLGAIVALEVVRRAPERVTRVALLNASARDGSTEQLEAWARLRDRLDAEPFEDVALDLVRANLPRHRRGDPELVARGQAMARSVGPEGLRRQLAAQATRPDSRPSLSTIDLPVLVVSGALDQVCPPALQEELGAGLPRSRHVVLDDVGHMAPIEAPAAVAAALRSWLRG